MKTLKRLFAASAAVVLSFVGLTASAKTVNLTMNTWADLKTAVANASSGDVISVTPVEGKYGEGQYYTAESTIKFNKSLTIMSASTSKPLKIYNGTTRLPVFEMHAGEVTLEKIFFTGSNVSTPATPQRGTIVSYANKLRLSYCSFDECTASISDAYDAYAGAVVARGSLLRMNDCLFRNCRVIKHVTDTISFVGQHCAGAVSTTAKETLVNYCSFIENGVEGFKSAGGFMENATPAGSPAMLTATFSTKGKVKVSATAGGAKVSGSAMASVGDKLCAVPFASTKRGVTVTFVLWLDLKTKALYDVTGIGAGATLVGAGAAAAPSAGDYLFSMKAADILASVPEAIAETPLKTEVPYAGGKFNAGKAAKVTYRGGALSIAGDNLAGLTLKYAKGALSGGFTVYAISNGRLVKNKFTLTGIILDGVGYITGTNRKLNSIPATLAR